MSMSHLPTRVVASAPSNIAFVKYWGKRDAALNLPLADSVSVCIDPFLSSASVELNGSDTTVVEWNGQPLGREHVLRFTRVLEQVPEASRSGRGLFVRITSGVVPRAGFSGSSAAMAAFALAVDGLFQLQLSLPQLSCLARLGSGSASRSVPDGFAHWQRGERADGSDSAACSIAGPEHWSELVLLLAVMDERPKPVSSTSGMIRTADTAPDFQRWVGQCRVLSALARKAILERDFAALGRLSQESAMAMHGLCLTAMPPILYVSQATIRLLELMVDISARLPVFYTLDAGPNPIIVTLESASEEVAQRLSHRFPETRLLRCKPGPGARVVSVE